MQLLVDVPNGEIRKMRNGGTMADQQDEHQAENNSVNTKEGIALSPQSSGGIYEIRVKGYLNSYWSDWLEGLEVKFLENGEMILFGPIVDQAALIGILNKISRLNLTLLSLNEVKTIISEEAK
jgi:hypothetical protein